MGVYLLFLYLLTLVLGDLSYGKLRGTAYLEYPSVDVFNDWVLVFYVLCG